MNERIEQENYGQILKIDVVPVPVVVPVGAWKMVVEMPPNEGVVVAEPVESQVGLRNVVVDAPAKEGDVVTALVVMPVGLRNVVMLVPLCP